MVAQPQEYAKNNGIAYFKRTKLMACELYVHFLKKNFTGSTWPQDFAHLNPVDPSSLAPASPSIDHFPQRSKDPTSDLPGDLSSQT